MAEAFTIESPDFNKIRKGDPHATEDAVRLLWLVLNEEMKLRRQGDRRIEERLSPKALTLAPSANQNNVDTQGAGIILYNTTSSVNITGYRAREEGDILFIHNINSGTLTHTNQDANSDAGNRMVNNGGGSVGIGQDQSAVYIYLNSRWRELSHA